MNEIIENKATGDRIEFLQTEEETDGRISDFIMTLGPKSAWAKSPMHFHPYQTETFKVLNGQLNLRVGKQHFVLGSSDEKIIVDPFVFHSFWNDQEEEVSFQAEIFPPRNIEKGIRLTYKLSQEGKINSKNIPYNPFIILQLMHYFDAYFPYIPWKLQKVFFNLGGYLSGLFGYK